MEFEECDSTRRRGDTEENAENAFWGGRLRLRAETVKGMESAEEAEKIAGRGRFFVDSVSLYTKRE